MAWLFSKRCSASLQSGKIKVRIPLKVRRRLWAAINNYNCSYDETTDTGFNYSTSILNKLPEKIKAEHGLQTLAAFPEDSSGTSRPTDNLEEFILRGNYPPYLFDSIELFYDQLKKMDPQNEYNFQQEFNKIMEETELPWRMADGKIFPVDSSYIEEVILKNTYKLIKEAKFEGALSEFEKARVDLVNEDFLGAIQNANLALESTIKGILGIKKAKPGQLFRSLIDSGLVPNYYEGFLQAFEKHILRSPAIIRNEELGAGHGQGATTNPVPKELAELAVNLSAVLINFLIKKYLAKTPQVEPEPEPSGEIPF